MIIKNKKINYDEPIEVSKNQYDLIIKTCKGFVANKIQNGKYFIKVWIMSCSKNVQFILENYD